MKISKKKYDDSPFKDRELEISFSMLFSLIGLSSTSLKLYLYIRGMSFRDNGIIYVDKKEAKQQCGFKQDKSFYNGITELVDSKILARTRTSFEYHYNPKFIEKEKEL